MSARVTMETMEATLIPSNNQLHSMTSCWHRKLIFLWMNQLPASIKSHQHNDNANLEIQSIEDPNA